MKTRCYSVATEKFGAITIEANSIAEARRDARTRFGVTNPRSVTAVREYAHCDSCDSAPCACGDAS